MSETECIYRKCYPKDSSRFRTFVESLAKDDFSNGKSNSGFANVHGIKTAIDTTADIVRPKNLILEFACFEKLIEANAEGQMLGHVDLCMSSDLKAVFGIAVRKEYRKKGIGTALMKCLISAAKVLGNDRPFSQVPIDKIVGIVEKNNVGAIQLYRSLGFAFNELDCRSFEIYKSVK